MSAQQWLDREIVQRTVAQIPWRSNLTLLHKPSDSETRFRYAEKTIGLLLFKSKNDLVVEYALDGYHRPMGVTQWESQLNRSLPEDLKGSLPSIEQIEKEMEGGDDQATL